MVEIKFGFSERDSHEFVVKTERREIIRDNKKIVTKYKVAKFKNPSIDCWSHINRMTSENAPKVLKNVEYFGAPNPFGMFGLGEAFEPYGWTMPMCLLAFKKGYIDGFFSHTGGMFSAFGSVFTDGIIVVDPLKRIEIRKYFEEEYKEFLEHCKEEDFEYSLTKDSSARLGISAKYESVEAVKNHLFEHKPKKEDFFQTERERKAVETYGFDKVFDALANILYYDTDLVSIWGVRTAKPLLFKSIQEAASFKLKYREWQRIYFDDEKLNLDIIPVNEKFDEWILNLRKKHENEMDIRDSELA